MAGLATLGPISEQWLQTLQASEEWCGYACLRNGIPGFPAPFRCLCLGFVACSALWNTCPVLVPQSGDTPRVALAIPWAPGCSAGVVWVWLQARGVTLLLRWRHVRADIAGLFECLPEDKLSVSTAEVNSASTKSRAQLIFHHHSLTVAE